MRQDRRNLDASGRVGPATPYCLVFRRLCSQIVPKFCLMAVWLGVAPNA